MRRNFIVFIGIIQIILWIGHWIIYAVLTHSLPWFNHYAITTAAVLGILSVSFLITSLVAHQLDTPLTRFAYTLSSSWLLVFWHTLIASAGITLAILIDNVGNVVVPVYVIAYILYAAAIAMSIYAFVNARIIRTTHVTVRLPNLPAQWKSKRIAMVSDIHLGHILRSSFSQKVVSSILGLHPDIVLIAGDFFDGIKTDVTTLAEPFKELTRSVKTICITGNHDVYFNIEEHIQAIEGVGIELLNDRVLTIDGLQIAGVGYSLTETTESYRNILASLPIDKALPSILLKHVPDKLHVAAERGVSLQLSGHTHHGQTWPFKYATRGIFKAFEYGLHPYQNMQVLTSSGVGTWGPPGRAFTKSETVVITLE